MSYQRSIPYKFSLNLKYKTNIWGHLRLEKKLTKVKWQKTYLKTKISQKYLSKKPKKIYLKRIFKYKLEEKQKLRYFYGNISFKKLKMFHNISKKKTNNNLSLNFIKLLESKLDVVLYRSNLINNIFVCKYLIKNGSILINNKTIKNNNYFLKNGDIIKFNLTKRKKEKLFNEFKRTIKEPLIGGRGPLLKTDQMIRKLFPKHLEINYSNFSINYLNDISNIEDLYYPFNLDIKASLNYFK